MMNAFSLAGVVLCLLASALVLWGLAAAVRAVFKRASYLKRPLGGEGQSIWSGAVEAKDVYVPGTILRKLGIVLCGVLVSAVALPLLWAGVALGEFVPIQDSAVIARMEVAGDGAVVLTPVRGAAIRGTLPDGIRVVHAELLTFRGWFARVGLGTYARPLYVASYPDARAVLERKGSARLEINPSSRFYRYAERLQRRYPTSIEAARRFTGPLPAGVPAEVWASATELTWRK